MGRPRDTELDAAILRAAAALLQEGGIGALTFEAVATRAGTSRPAIYRRYDSTTELAVAALGHVAPTAGAERTGDPLTDLVAELEAFRTAITRFHGLNVVASILLDTTDDAVKTAYRRDVVQRRRNRLRHILDDAAEQAPVAPDPRDRAAAVSMCTGSWYAHALAGDEPPPDWPRRTAELLWRALELP